MNQGPAELPAPWPFPRPKALIGMIHVGALPGAPFHRAEPISVLAHRAAAEARLLARAGFDAVMIENMHDRPYLHGRQSPAIVSAMTAVALAVRDAAPDTPLGVQVLSGGNLEALAIAHACGGTFIRCENFVFAHVADEGLLPEAEAGPLLRARRDMGAASVRIYADIKKKHASHALTADVPIADAAHAAAFFGADGVIVTGAATARPASEIDLKSARSGSTLPVLVGSGVTPDNIAAMFTHADAVIVGSWFKKDGLWSNDPDPARVDAIAGAAHRARPGS